MDPAALLAAKHEERTRDRTVVGLWLAELPPEERERFREFILAFKAHAAYRIPVLLEAIRADEVLGEGGAEFPDTTGESMKKFLKRYDAEATD